MNIVLNCCLDFIGLALVFIIFIYGRLNGRDHREQFIFDALLVSNIVLIVTDALTWCLDGTPTKILMISYHVSQFFCYLSAATIVLLWAIYCDWRLVGNSYRIKWQIIYFGYWLLFLMLMIINIFYPIFFSIDSSNVYHREYFYFVYVLYNALFLLHTFVQILRVAPTKNPVLRKDAYALLLFSLPPMIGVCIQFNVFGVSILPVSLSISLLLIFVHRLTALITIDNLTGLNNRRSFEHNLEMKISTRDEKELLFLMVMDANNFKAINDLYGHKVGDDALIEIATALKHSCKQGDILARLGGDEFVILGKRKSELDIKATFAHIEEQLLLENQSSKHPYQLSLSIGYSIYPPKSHLSSTDFFQLADEEMYKDKTNRKQSRNT